MNNEKENSVDSNSIKEDKTIDPDDLDDWVTKIYEDESLPTDDEESDNEEELSEPNIISPELTAYMVALRAWQVNKKR